MLEAIANCFGKHTYTEQPYSFKDEINKEEGLTDAEKFAAWAVSFNKDNKNKKNKG